MTYIQYLPVLTKPRPIPSWAGCDFSLTALPNPSCGGVQCWTCSGAWALGGAGSNNWPCSAPRCGTINNRNWTDTLPQRWDLSWRDRKQIILISPLKFPLWKGRGQAPYKPFIEGHFVRNQGVVPLSFCKKIMGNRGTHFVRTYKYPFCKYLRGGCSCKIKSCHFIRHVF